MLEHTQTLQRPLGVFRAIACDAYVGLLSNCMSKFSEVSLDY